MTELKRVVQGLRRSGDRDIWSSGDRAEGRWIGWEIGQMIGRSGNRNIARSEHREIGTSGHRVSHGGAHPSKPTPGLAGPEARRRGGRPTVPPTKWQITRL